MEDCQLRCHPQTWKKVILTPKILLSNLTAVMFWEASGDNCGKTSLSDYIDVWCDPPIANGCPTGKLCNRCPTTNNNPHRELYL